MVKNYPKEAALIAASSADFNKFILGSMERHNALAFYDHLRQKTKVYIFSGVIRNYFCGFRDVRDLDFVVKETDISKIKIILESFTDNIRVNSYGGLKAKINDLSIDIWPLSRTWGIQRKGLRPNCQSLLHTSFFNFSSIVYDCEHNRFIYSEEFCKFLQEEVMEIVFKENPNIPLCIVNALYYNYYYGFRVGVELSKWIAQNYDKNIDYDLVQIKHWGITRFSTNIIESFVNQCAISFKNNLLFTINLL